MDTKSVVRLTRPWYSTSSAEKGKNPTKKSKYAKASLSRDLHTGLGRMERRTWPLDCTDGNWTRGCWTKLWSAMNSGRLRSAVSPQAYETPWRAILAGVFSLIVAIGIGRFAYTPTLPAMQAGLGLSTPAAGALASSNNLGYLVGAALAAFVPAGRARGR